MKDLVAAEKVEKDYIVGHSKENVELRVLDLALLEEMKKASKNRRYIEERIEFYDDEDDTSEINWIDIEGEGYGWVWLNHPPRKWHSEMRKKMLRFVRHLKDTLTSTTEKRYVVVVKYIDYTIYHFIDREESECDTIYTFSDSLVY